MVETTQQFYGFKFKEGVWQQADA
jgi:endonuclease/exonuclease/phosphatase family metal-dependent hydrolase